MGYTHYWTYPPADLAFARAWPRIVGEVRIIAAACTAAGVTLAGPLGRGVPIIETARGVLLNGDAGTDGDYESFILTPPDKSVTGRPFQFCKTARRPYDLVVTAVLLRCRLLLPDVFAIDSDGRWDQEWDHGVGQPGQPAFGLGARRMVTDLFGAVPAASPFGAG